MTHTVRRATLALLTAGAAAGAVLVPGVAAAAPVRGPDLQVVRSNEPCSGTVVNRGDVVASGVRVQWAGLVFDNTGIGDIAPGGSARFGYIGCGISRSIPVFVIAYAGNGEANPFDNVAQVNP
ncbi:hypothetical protein [Rhodococcoides kroppenstedtii]|uniref:hypothetical protein n=1 Tax=Rhodococcoides kroppenstedtii TaxID=293050 RepID=UPI00362D4DDF